MLTYFFKLDSEWKAWSFLILELVISCNFWWVITEELELLTDNSSYLLSRILSSSEKLFSIETELCNFASVKFFSVDIEFLLIMIGICLLISNKKVDLSKLLH